MMQLLTTDGRPWVSWDSDQHPYWPPVDGDGKLIGDLPWKFFDPEPRPAAAADLREKG